MAGRRDNYCCNVAADRGNRARPRRAALIAFTLTLALETAGGVHLRATRPRRRSVPGVGSRGAGPRARLSFDAGVGVGVRGASVADLGNADAELALMRAGIAASRATGSTMFSTPSSRCSLRASFNTVATRTRRGASMMHLPLQQCHGGGSPGPSVIGCGGRWHWRRHAQLTHSSVPSGTSAQPERGGAARGRTPARAARLNRPRIDARRYHAIPRSAHDARGRTRSR